MKSRLPLFALTPLLLSCAGNPASSLPASSEPSASSSEPSVSSSSSLSSGQTIVIDGVSFQSRQMPVVLRNPKNKVSGTFYFREDGMKNIAYVKMGDYYRYLLEKELRFQEDVPGVFTVHSAAGGMAIIDTTLDTFHSPDMELFICTTIFRQEGVTNTYFDGAPFLRVRDTAMEREPMPKDIAFMETYGIDLFAYEGEVLLPLVTASNLFQGPTMLTCFATTDTVYFIDPNDESYSTSRVITDDEYISGLFGFYENGKRSPEQAAFNYGELCFFVDTFYGQPGRERLHDSLTQYGALDEALKNHSEITKKAQELLRSTDQAEYCAGLTILADHLDDTGHSGYGFGLSTVEDAKPALARAVNELLRGLNYDSESVKPTRPGKQLAAYVTPLRNAIKDAGLETKKTIVSGDTALYTFRNFNFDAAAWADYYAGKRATLPDDEVGCLKKALDQYKNSGVKNFILDVSNNGGGFGDVVATMMAMMGKESYFHYYDFVNKTPTTTRYDVDTNFDGVFDERDREFDYPYRFGVLASGYSFSCANILPCQAKESGICLLGDQTGGGACAVLDACSAEGLYTRSSSQIRLETKDHSSVDFGVAPHANLLRETPTGLDFSQFFDLRVLSAQMNAFYDGAK